MKKPKLSCGKIGKISIFAHDKLAHYKLPKTRKEQRLWANYFYEYTPVVHDWINFLFIYWKKPPTLDQITDLLIPYFKILSFNELERFKIYKRASRGLRK